MPARAPAPESQSPLLVAALVFVVSLLAAAAVVWRLDQRSQEVEHLRVENLASDHAVAVQAAMEHALSATYAIAAMVRQSDGELPQFEGVATEMLPWYPGVSTLGLSPGGVIARVVPLQGNEKSLGFDQLNDARQGREARLARDSGQLTLAGPLQLVQGGLGAVGRLPVFIPGPGSQPRFWGLVYAVLRLPQALSSAHLERLSENGLHYVLWRTAPDSQMPQIIDASTTDPLQAPVQRSVRVPNGEWVLSVAPKSGWLTSGDLVGKGLLALLFSAILAFAAKLLVELKVNERGREALIAQRTREIEASRHKLEATLEALPDVMLEMDAQGRFVDYHAPRVHAGFPPEAQIMGHSAHEALPEAAAEAVMRALAEAQQHGHSQGREFALNTSESPSWYEISMARKAGQGGADARFIVLARDITQRKQAEDAINQLAFYDALTGLPNRRLMLDRLRLALANCARSGHTGALLFIDLDNFKTLNDTQGHDIGDLLLQQVAQRLTLCMREGDTVARLGGDEFVVMAEELSTHRDEAAAQAEAIGAKLLHAIGQPCRLAGLDYQITPSIGVALYADREQTSEDLLKQADMAMYQSKSAGRNTVRFFDPAMQAVITRRVALEGDIRQAILRAEFQLYYQPQVDRHGRCFGAEVLLRWPHPSRGMVSPAEFIPLAEESGLILPLGNWVLETACTQLAAWAKEPALAHLTLSVNVSPRQFRQPDFVPYVLDLMAYTAVNPRRLKLELTESLLVDDVRDTTSKMNALKQRGVGFSLDDFGTGYSSLSYLKQLPLDQLKIDQSFVRDLMTDPNDAAIALAVITLGHALGLAVIAEGVENLPQREHLERQGCDAFQGYLFGRPMPLPEMEALLHHAH